MRRSTIPPPIGHRPRRIEASLADCCGRRGLLAAFAAGSLALAAGPADAGREEEAAAFIKRIADRALSILSQTDKDQKTRIAELERLLEEATDLDLIAKMVLGSYWRRATPDQRRRYLELFRKLVRKELASKINRYNGERIEVVGSRDIDDRDTVVSTLVHRAEKQPPYRVDWRVRRSKGRFLIIDVVAEGVSLLITKSGEFREIVAKRGIEGLLAGMARQLEGEDTQSQVRS